MKATEYITALSKINFIDYLVDDETEDHNLRYIGKDPNNYVQFNGELWRIIGVMNDVADEAGTIEPRIKLIRSRSIGKYSWDNKASGTGSSTSENGSNDWSDSAIQEILNKGVYYNRTSGYCPYGYGNTGSIIACDFTSNGLTTESKIMINSVVWKLGGVWSTSYPISQLYTSERGTEVYSGRPTEWTGEVGLMYPSDYGYATSGGNNKSREKCLNSMYWYSDVSFDCRINDWLYNPSEDQWTITPSFSNGDYAYYNRTIGIVNTSVTTNMYNILPVVYLNTNIKITSGSGSSTDPYILTV